MEKHMPLSVRVPIELDNPSICRKEDLCIKCGQCREVCTNAIGVLGTYNLSQTGGNAICIHCGQCASRCPYHLDTPSLLQYMLKDYDEFYAQHHND